MTTPTPDSGDDMSREELERLQARLAAPAPPEGVLDRARAAAMESFDEVHSGAAAPAADVRDIRSTRPEPGSTPPWYQRIPLGAAAAVVAVVALVGVFTQIDLSTDDADTATAETDDSGDSAGDSGSEFEESSAALDAGDDGDEAARESLDDAVTGGATSGSGGDASSAPAPDGAMPAYDDVDALVESLRTRYSTTHPQSGESAPSTTSTAAEFDREDCDAFGAAGVESATVLSEEFVVLGPDGDQSVAIVVVYDSDDTGLRVAVVDEASCSLLDDRAL